MGEASVGIGMLSGLIVLVACRLPIGVALVLVSFCALTVLRGFDAAFSMLGSVPYEFASSWTLSAVPMFILMGAIIHHSGVAAQLFTAARAWLGRVPGGLAVAANFSSAIFAAACGSSLATANAMGRIAVPEMLKARYEPAFASGVVSAAGVLGAMIPPSVAFILFGWYTEQPIGKLMIAGILPGLMTAFAFATFIIIYAALRPEVAPPDPVRASWDEKLKLLLQVWPTPLLILLVIGGLYRGVFTATEAGAIGAALTFLIVILSGRFSWKMVRDSLMSALSSTVTIFFIAAGAVLLTRALAFTGLPEVLAQFLNATGTGVVGVLLVMVFVYIFLGMFLDPIGIMLITLPILLPVFKSADMDLIWIGVITVKLLEIGLITPPVGLNAFMVKAAAGDAVAIGDVFKGLTPFLIIEVLLVGVLILFPQISLFLPSLMG